jgi:Tol biopolymer transport system component
MLLDVRDGSTRNVSNHAAFDHQPAWLPDGCGLLFTSKRSGDLELWLADVCG